MTELVLKDEDTRLGLASLSHIKTSLDRLFGKGEWVKWEPETISLGVGMVLDDLLLDKIHVLQIIERMPELFFNDSAFLLFATDVINNQVADFDYMPAPTSLELAYALSEVQKVLSENGKSVEFGDSIIMPTAWILRQEGYSKPLEPFHFVPEAMLVKGQTTEDTANKAKAISDYIKHMEAL